MKNGDSLKSKRIYVYFALPVALLGAALAFWIQDIDFFRRNALLAALLAGMLFFMPMMRRLTLILFCYGYGFYVWAKFFYDLRRWELLSARSQIETALWFPIGLFCIAGALALGTEPPLRWAGASLMLGLMIYFGGYTFLEASVEHWMQAAAGTGFTLLAGFHAYTVWKRSRQPKQETTAS